MPGLEDLADESSRAGAAGQGPTPAGTAAAARRRERVKPVASEADAQRGTTVDSSESRGQQLPSAALPPRPAAARAPSADDEGPRPAHEERGGELPEVHHLEQAKLAMFTTRFAGGGAQPPPRPGKHARPSAAKVLSEDEADSGVVRV